MDSAANSAVHDAFDVEEYNEVAFAILQPRIPFVSLSKLTFPDQVSQCGSFIKGLLGRSSATSLLTLPPKAAVLGAFPLLSRVKDVEFSALVGPVPRETCRLVSAERDTTGPIPLVIQNSLMFPVAVGVVRLLDARFFNELLTLSGLPKLFKERLTSLERNLPDPPAGLSPGQTART